MLSLSALAPCAGLDKSRQEHLPVFHQGVHSPHPGLREDGAPEHRLLPQEAVAGNFCPWTHLETGNDKRGWLALVLGLTLPTNLKPQKLQLLSSLSPRSIPAWFELGPRQV